MCYLLYLKNIVFSLLFFALLIIMIAILSSKKALTKVKTLIGVVVCGFCLMFQELHR